MLLKTLMILTTILVTKGNYTIEQLKENIYIEEEAKVHLYHETWRLIIGINFTSNVKRLEAIDDTIQLAGTACGRKCALQHEVQSIRNRYKRLAHKNSILKKLLGEKIRTKRGLANFIGDISKTLFGTLNENDLNQIDHEFDNI